MNAKSVTLGSFSVGGSCFGGFRPLKQRGHGFSYWAPRFEGETGLRELRWVGVGRLSPVVSPAKRGIELIVTGLTGSTGSWELCNKPGIQAQLLKRRTLFIVGSHQCAEALRRTIAALIVENCVIPTSTIAPYRLSDASADSAHGQMAHLTLGACTQTFLQPPRGASQRWEQAFAPRRRGGYEKIDFYSEC
jgi:hypothetical protein